MNREIKFRAWDGDKKQMHLPEYSDKETFHVLADGTIVETREYGFERHEMTSARPDTWTLMQYTALKDKNGKEIYEGDILRITWRTPNYGKYFQSDDMWNDNEEIVFVEWRNMGFAFIEKSGKQHSKRKDADIEIIGNINENPELLK